MSSQSSSQPADQHVDFISELQWRGLLHQSTGEEALRQHLSAPRRAYVGFDPTAPSLTIGNLVGILALVRFALAGHSPVIVVGGATGLIGDPSGKSAERTLNTPETVQDNVLGQTRIYHNVWKNASLLTGQPLGEPPIRNNYDWFKPISFLDALRDIGKHFSVNMMIQKESVKERLHNRDQGISYTEFSYMLLQAYDFLHLWKSEGVTLQMGGSDQFGNIICGSDLIRRHAAHTHADTANIGQHDTFGLTWPLVTKSDGGKFGKTESGAIWLTADRTSPYAFYQFWLNAADADVVKFLKIFTLLDKPEIERLTAALAANPGAREAHRALARHMTTLLHGPAEMELAEKAAKALFSGDIAGLPLATLEEALASAPSSDHTRASLDPGIPLLDFLITTNLASSKREAREFLANGSVSVNGSKAGPDDTLTTNGLLHNRLFAIRRGKKNWHVARFA